MNQELSFGAFVRQHRREMDLTQEELARRVGCAAITLRKIEADDLRASVQIAERLAMALAIPLEERAEFVRWARTVRPASSELPPVTPAPSIEEIGREDLTGRAIRGYALAERIGMGGMGSVYRAVQPNVEREVAIKIILPAFANHPDFIRRFEAEAQLVARLEHPHIVPLYDYWREPGVAYLVMRLLRGGNIQNLLGQGALSIEMTTRILEQICSALNAAHRFGVIHRDLKPANVLLDDDANAYLADFGIAKNLGNPDLENQTQMDAMIGSPQYMSPEQIRSLSVRPQTDIYCLGVMLYEMLTGTLPFTGPTPFDMIQQHINTPMPPLAANRAGLPAALDAVIRCATAKDPQDRYADTPSFFQEYRRAVDGMVNVHPVLVSYEEEDSDLEITNPFKGLRAFGEADADNFFGRETLVQQLLARLGEGGDLSRFLAVIGPSGSGKSSVVRAGLIPALRRGGLPGSENWFLVDMLPGKHPFEELEASLLRVAVNPPESLLSQMKDGSRGLLRAIHRILPADEAVELVLVIDQFEEVFTLVDDESERALLLESLAAAVLDERSRLHVIITLRADFTDRPLRYVDFGELMNRRFEFVLPLTMDEVERAVAGPAQRVGLRLEKGLVSTILREAGNQPGTLPLLQYALSELFDKRDGRTLTNKAYHEIGGVLGALGRSAESIYQNLEKTEKLAARQLFLRLVTLGEGTEDTRRRMLREELEAIDASQHSVIQNVIVHFGKARLLTFDHDPLTRGATVEVAHEALLQEWKRLRDWLYESRADIRLQRQLAAAAKEWLAAQQDASFLMAGSRLDQFESWAANSTVALTKIEHAFIDISIQERNRRAAEERGRQQRELEAAQKLVETERRRAESEARSARQLRQRAVYLSIVLALAVIAAVTAVIFANRYATNLTRSQAQRLAAGANSLLAANGDPNLIALLSIRSLDTQYSTYGDAMLASLTTLGAPPREYKAQEGELHGADFSPDGRYLVTAEGLSARLLDLATGETLRVFSGHTDMINPVVFSPDGKSILTGSIDGTARLWDVASGQMLQILSGESPEFYNVTFSPDGKTIATVGGLNGRIWDADTGQLLHTLSGHDGELFGVAFSPDGTQLLTGSFDQTARLWDVVTGEEIRVFSGHAGSIEEVAFSPDGKYIATASDDQTARIWDVETGEVVRELIGHQGIVGTIDFSTDGHFAITGALDKTVRLWDVNTGQTVRVLYNQTDVSIAEISSDGRLVFATNADDNTTRVWDLLLPPPGGMLYKGEGSRLWDASFSPDGKLVVTANDDNIARIWDTNGGKLLVKLIGHSNSVLSGVFSPDGKTVLTSSADGTARLWEVASGRELRRFEGHEDIIRDAIFSPDGRRVVTASLDGTARVWDTQTAQTLLTYKNPDGVLLARAAFSPDGEAVATTTVDGKIRIWDVNDGMDLQVLEGHKNELSVSLVTGVGFSPDGKYLVTTGFDGTVHLWDISSGKELRSFDTIPGGTYNGIFTSDGEHVLAGGDDGTVRLWNISTGEEERRFTGHTSRVVRMDISPDGKYLLTASHDGTARLWLMDYHETIRAVCDLLTRDLTPEERVQFDVTAQTPTCPEK